MSRSLSVANVIEKNKLASGTPYLVFAAIGVIHPTTKELVETIRVVRNNEDVTYQGQLWVATAFDIELKEEANTQPTITVSFADMTRGLQARLQEYGGGVGFTVTLIVQAANNLTQDPEVIEQFEVLSSSAEEYHVSFQIGAESALTKSFPRRRQTRDYCQWKYKSAECGYTGPLPTCDYSLSGPNGCGAHNNTIRFGAFPGVNSNGRRFT